MITLLPAELSDDAPAEQRRYESPVSRGHTSFTVGSDLPTRRQPGAAQKCRGPGGQPPHSASDRTAPPWPDDRRAEPPTGSRAAAHTHLSAAGRRLPDRRRWPGRRATGRACLAGRRALPDVCRAEPVAISIAITAAGSPTSTSPSAGWRCSLAVWPPPGSSARCSPTAPPSPAWRWPAYSAAGRAFPAGSTTLLRRPSRPLRGAIGRSQRRCGGWTSPRSAVCVESPRCGGRICPRLRSHDGGGRARTRTAAPPRWAVTVTLRL